MSARLSEILRSDLDIDPEIRGVTADSRKVRPGFLFAALPGSKIDGRSFIPTALQAGAAAVLAPEAMPELPVPVAHAWDVRRAYALAAGAFYGAQPTTCVAVTGTNGKTSVADYCRQIFDRLGHKAASMGTLGVALSPRAGGEQLTPPGLTTPDAADVAANLADLAQRGVTHLAMEASSHGIDQRRLDAVRLRAAGFLNLTQDHLDYHGTMGAYRASKLRLFETLLPRGGTAVLNADSDAYSAFASASVMAGHAVMSVGEKGQGLRLVERVAVANGQRLTVRSAGERFSVLLPLAGAYQASNALVAAGLCIAAGEDAGEVMAALEHIKGAPGRLQRIGAGPRGGEAYVDYAHTPDGLETVLKALRPHAKGRLMVVFGAGGDRDRSKRPLMGKAAADLADLVIVTDDNPRGEEPAMIRTAILAAAPGALEISDRREAINTAVAGLRDGDILVVAGKGHERGQIVGGVTHPFDDIAEVAQALGVGHG
jgi:UDP-N-acetylmuramoyl-L-alanyl-D-glutamate--2,6-diaminopimelate ligase